MSYLRRLADQIRAGIPKPLVPPDSDDLFLLYAVLARAKGTGVQPQDVHDAWVAWMESRGRSHESMVPFADLPASTRAEDNPFVKAIHMTAQHRDPPE